jgi:hypothetical protein
MRDASRLLILGSGELGAWWNFREEQGPAASVRPGNTIDRFPTGHRWGFLRRRL